MAYKIQIAVSTAKMYAVSRRNAAELTFSCRIQLHSFEVFRDQIGVSPSIACRFSRVLTTLQYVFTLGLAASAALDVLVTASLCYFLDQSRTGFASYGFHLLTLRTS